MKNIYLISALLVTLAACNRVTTTEVRLTSEAGDKYALQDDITFRKGKAPVALVTVNPADERQTIDGFGASITESSAFVLACLVPEQRKMVLHELFGEEGANFSATRTVIGSSDFTLKGHYSYDDIPGDDSLKYFSLAVHQDGWDKAVYPQIKDESFDMYQFIREVADIKASQSDPTWRLLGSPWTAPAWMKDNNLFYDHDNRRGGALLPKYYDAFARYFAKYLQAYRDAGIEFWAVTPENEPMGNDGSWESMDLTPDAEAEFIGKYLGPTLAQDFPDVQIFCFDQNTFEADRYTAAVYDRNADANRYTAGTALHWYGSTVSCFPEILDSLHALYPDKILMHTEGCVDNLGRPGWPGVSDYAGYQESGWFNNDAFWWGENATDWAYSTPWWPEWHPKYSPVHRYAQYIIDGVNHWMTGYIDWNSVLDSIGGPTHVQNYCGAQVMIDYNNDIIYFTPYHYAFRHFSRSMRPGDIALGVSTIADNPDLHVCAVKKAVSSQTSNIKHQTSYAINMLNRAQEPCSFNLQLGNYFATIHLPANCVETIEVTLPK